MIIVREANTRPLNAPNASPSGDYAENERLLVKSFGGHREKRRERANSCPAVAAWARDKHILAREADD